MNQVISAYEENIAPATPMSVEILKDYCNDLSPELVKVAIEKAVEVNKRSIKYIKGILNDWLKKGIKNIIDVKNEEEAFRKSKEKIPLEETEEEKIKRRTRELEEYINANK